MNLIILPVAMGGTGPIANGGIIPVGTACIGIAWPMVKAAVGIGAVFNGAIGATGGIPAKIVSCLFYANITNFLGC